MTSIGPAPGLGAGPRCVRAGPDQGIWPQWQMPVAEQ
jgi:hypothetical protein